jgi:hypothetical protein
MVSSRGIACVAVVVELVVGRRDLGMLGGRICNQSVCMLYRICMVELRKIEEQKRRMRERERRLERKLHHVKRNTLGF